MDAYESSLRLKDSSLHRNYLRLGIRQSDCLFRGKLSISFKTRYLGIG